MKHFLCNWLVSNWPKVIKTTIWFLALQKNDSNYNFLKVLGAPIVREYKTGPIISKKKKKKGSIFAEETNKGKVIPLGKSTGGENAAVFHTRFIEA